MVGLWRNGDKLEKDLLTSASRLVFCTAAADLMDALKAEVAAKRKAIQDEPLAARPTKYMRRGEIERLKEEQELKARDEKRQVDEAARRETEAEAAAARAAKVSPCFPSIWLILILEWRTGPFSLSYQIASSCRP